MLVLWVEFQRSAGFANKNREKIYFSNLIINHYYFKYKYANIFVNRKIYKETWLVGIRTKVGDHALENTKVKLLAML